MGVSTDAVVAYGVDLGDDVEFDTEQFTDAIHAAAGLSDPYADAPDNDPEYSEWRAQPGKAEEIEVWRKASNEAEDEFPFDLETHCSGDYPMYALVRRGSAVTAYRGYPKTLDIDSMGWSNLPAWPIESLDALRPHLPGLPDRSELAEPSWLLFSYWSY